MKQYKKPLMKIVELEKVDVLTCSCAFHDGDHTRCTEANSVGCNHITLTNIPETNNSAE